MDEAYKKAVFPDACLKPCKQWKESPKDCVCKQKMQTALERAHKIRQFEIDLYWRRSLYFWGFQAVFFTACALIFSEFLSNSSLRISAPLIAIALLGFIVSILWFFLEKGSKAWQENWEHHIDQLEDEFTGRLHKTVLGSAGKFYSVTKINQFFIVVIGFAWLIFLVLQICSDDVISCFLEMFYDLRVCFYDNYCLWSALFGVLAALAYLRLKIKSSFPNEREHGMIKKSAKGIGEGKKTRVYYRWKSGSRKKWLMRLRKCRYIARILWGNLFKNR